MGDKELNKYIGKLPVNAKNDENKSENEGFDQSNEDEAEDLELLKILNVYNICF